MILTDIYLKVKQFFKKEDAQLVPSENILLEVHKNKGLLWEKIALFKERLLELPNSVSHTAGKEQSNGMKELFPLEHHIEGGLYTREVFMPKHTCVVSFIHKQDHPSFIISGEASVLMDTGEIIKYKAPDKIMTKKGTQRVFFMHEDTRWVCVYKTDKETVTEAEKDIYTEDWRDLPIEIINQNKLLCQE